MYKNKFSKLNQAIRTALLDWISVHREIDFLCSASDTPEKMIAKDVRIWGIYIRKNRH